MLSNWTLSFRFFLRLVMVTQPVPFFRSSMSAQVRAAASDLGISYVPQEGEQGDVNSGPVLRPFCWTPRPCLGRRMAV